MASKKPKIDYPLVTKGSKLAAKLRKRCNGMSDKEREEHFAAGMVMIYGGRKPSPAHRS